LKTINRLTVREIPAENDSLVQLPTKNKLRLRGKEGGMIRAIEKERTPEGMWMAEGDEKGGGNIHRRRCVPKIGGKIFAQWGDPKKCIMERRYAK